MIKGYAINLHYGSKKWFNEILSFGYKLKMFRKTKLIKPYLYNIIILLRLEKSTIHTVKLLKRF